MKLSKATITSSEGVTKTYEEWASHYGVSAETIRNRVLRGWPIDEVLSKRHGRGGKKLGQANPDKPIAPVFDCKERHARWVAPDES